MAAFSGKPENRRDTSPPITSVPAIGESVDKTDGSFGKFFDSIAAVARLVPKTTTRRRRRERLLVAASKQRVSHHEYKIWKFSIRAKFQNLPPRTLHPTPYKLAARDMYYAGKNGVLAE